MSNILLDPELLTRQIASRKLVSDSMHDLYIVNSKIDERALRRSIELHGDRSFWHDFSWLVGVAFSLWRAVFLTAVSVERRPTDVRTDVHKFLHYVLRDTMINFGQDRDAREFSVGYYLGNASFRLIAIGKRRPGIQGLGEFEAAENPMKLGMHNSDAQDRWDQCYGGFLSASAFVVTELEAELKSCDGLLDVFDP